MAHIVKIDPSTGAGDILNLNNQAVSWTYRLKENAYAPGLAQLGQRRLGEEIYGEIVERFTLMIRGDTEAACWAALERLQSTLNEAVNYAAGGRELPVKLNIQPNGSTPAGDPVSIILPLGDTPMVQAPATALKGANGYLIDGVKVSFRRRPLLTDVGDTDLATSGGAAAQGTVQSMFFAEDYGIWTPTDVLVSGFTAGGGSAPGPGLLAVAPEATMVPVLDSSSFGTFTTPGSWSTVAEATAQGGNVRRYTPASTSAEVALCTHGGVGYRKALFALVRNNSSSREYMLRGVSRVASTNYYGRPAVVDGSLTTPQLVPLGAINTPLLPTALGVEITPSATGGTIDLDLLQAVYLDTPPVSMSWINKIQLANFGVTGAWTLQMLANYVSQGSASGGSGGSRSGGRPVARAFQSVSAIAPISVYGDSLVYTGVSGAAVSLIMPDGAYWCVGSGSRQNVTVSLHRTRVHGGLR